MLTFLVLLCLARRLEIVPSNAVVAPEAVDVRHRVHPSPDHVEISALGTGTDRPRDHTHNKARSSLFANLIFVADCMRLWAGSSSSRTTTSKGHSLPPPVSTRKRFADQFVLECLWERTRLAYKRFGDIHKPHTITVAHWAQTKTGWPW